MLLRFPFGANSDSVASRDDADQSSRDNWEGDLFGARLDQIINMKHELVQLAGKLDWECLDQKIARLLPATRSAQGSRPGLSSVSLLLKHIFALSDEEVCKRWIYDPYFLVFHQRGVLPARAIKLDLGPPPNGRAVQF